MTALFKIHKVVHYAFAVGTTVEVISQKDKFIGFLWLNLEFNKGF